MGSSGTEGATVATNRKAKHDYTITTTFEAGLVLCGSEVKSARAGLVNLKEGYVIEVEGELFLGQVHISEYRHANQNNHLPTRRRKLLLHRHQIDKITSAIRQDGMSCVPLRMYLKGGHLKLEIGIVRGKKLWDRRQDVKERDAKREMARARRHDG